MLLVEPGEPIDRRHLSERLRGATAPAGDRPLSLDDAVARAERQAFEIALAVAAGNHSRAMELLGVPRTTYYRKLKELDAAPAVSRPSWSQ